MRIFKGGRWGIGVRLAGGYAILLALLAGVALLGIDGMRSSNAALHHTVAVNVRKMQLIGEMEKSVHIVAGAQRTIALLGGAAGAEAEQLQVRQARQRYDQAFAALRALPLDQAGQALVARIGAQQALTRPLNDQFIALAARAPAQALTLLLQSSAPATAQWQALLEEFMQLQANKSALDETAAAAAYQTAMTLMLALSGAALVFGVLVAWLGARSITAPIGAAVKVAQTVASGDLGTTIQVRSHDETGLLLQALSDMNVGLVAIVGQVRGGTDAIAATSQQIAMGNLDLSARTERQASALQETAAALEQLSSTVSVGAQDAQSARQQALAACAVAARAADTVAQVSTTMTAIDTAARRVADIIGVIDALAFQTNILALNAAVEAARAGEQGRGFAVVAAEVRQLAQRSALAAKEIKTLIAASVEQVGCGAHTVKLAGATMQEVVLGIDGVAQTIDQISAASCEQASGLTQISGAVSQMDEVTQQNAALVEQVAAAAGALREQAGGLVELVSVFRLGSAAPAR